ncbi:hypothetical protein SEVIR_2G324651v4 [Setaria viridis]
MPIGAATSLLTSMAIAHDDLHIYTTTRSWEKRYPVAFHRPPNTMPCSTSEIQWPRETGNVCVVSSSNSTDRARGAHHLRARTHTPAVRHHLLGHRVTKDRWHARARCGCSPPNLASKQQLAMRVQPVCWFTRCVASLPVGWPSIRHTTKAHITVFLLSIYGTATASE